MHKKDAMHVSQGTRLVKAEKPALAVTVKKAGMLMPTSAAVSMTNAMQDFAVEAKQWWQDGRS